MISYVFWHENEGIHGIWAYCYFSSNVGSQKYTAKVPGDPTLNCFCSVMDLSKERCKCSEPDCYNLVFSLLNNILVWYMSKKVHFV